MTRVHAHRDATDEEGGRGRGREGGSTRRAKRAGGGEGRGGEGSGHREKGRDTPSSADTPSHAHAAALCHDSVTRPDCIQSLARALKSFSVKGLVRIETSASMKFS